MDNDLYNSKYKYLKYKSKLEKINLEGGFLTTDKNCLKKIEKAKEETNKTCLTTINKAKEETNKTCLTQIENMKKENENFSFTIATMKQEEENLFEKIEYVEINISSYNQYSDNLIKLIEKLLHKFRLKRFIITKETGHTFTYINKNNQEETFDQIQLTLIINICTIKYINNNKILNERSIDFNFDNLSKWKKPGGLENNLKSMIIRSVAYEQSNYLDN